jgi:hypothetical protein
MTIAIDDSKLWDKVRYWYQHKSDYPGAFEDVFTPSNNGLHNLKEISINQINSGLMSEGHVHAYEEFFELISGKGAFLLRRMLSVPQYERLTADPSNIRERTNILNGFLRHNQFADSIPSFYDIFKMLPGSKLLIPAGFAHICQFKKDSILVECSELRYSEKKINNLECTFDTPSS